MRNYTMEAFSDELTDLIKQADVMKDIGNPVSFAGNVKSSLMSVLGGPAINLAGGAIQDVMNGRAKSMGADLTDLAHKVRNPASFGEGLSGIAKNYFLGSSHNPEGQKKLLHLGRAAPLIFNTLPAVLDAKDILPENDPQGRGRSRIARSAEFVGKVGGGILGSRMGGLAGAVTGVAGQALGSGVGAGIDYLTGHSQTKNRG